MTGFPILYHKRKFIRILPKLAAFTISMKYLHIFMAVLQVKNLTYYFIFLRYTIEMFDTSQLY